MGDYEANGEGLSKKIAKTSAALNMFNSTIPEDWRTAADNAKRKKKRKATTSTSSSAPTPSKQPNLAPQKPPETKPVDPKLICNVIQTAHPISALFEYCKKGELLFLAKTRCSECSTSESCDFKIRTNCFPFSVFKTGSFTSVPSVASPVLFHQFF